MAQKADLDSTSESAQRSGFRNNNIVNISSHGDLVLQIEEGCSSKIICYRVSSTALRSISSYFDVLLDPAKFSEGIETGVTTAQLEKDYPDISLVPTSSLPKISITDVGRFPAGMSNKNILSHFFRILHDPHYASPNIATPQAVVLLAIVADRFDAAAPVSTFIKANKKAMKAVLKSRDEIVNGKVAEEVVRQNILSGLLLHIDGLVLQWSWRLIIEGSSKWYVEEDEHDPKLELQWWNLPSAIESRSIKILAGYRHFEIHLVTDFPQANSCIGVLVFWQQSPLYKITFCAPTLPKPVNASLAMTRPLNATRFNLAKW